MKSERMEKRIHENRNEKKAGIAMFISDTRDRSKREVCNDKVSVQKEDTTFENILCTQHKNT